MDPRRRGRRAAPGQWYLHLFDTKQPDLDWTNEEVRDEFRSILRFWFDRGVDGFRIDVAHGLAKDPAMPDLAGRFAVRRAGRTRASPLGPGRGPRGVPGAGGGSATPMPASGRSSARSGWRHPERLARYLRPDELHTAFNFDFLLAPWDADGLRPASTPSIGALAAVGAPPTWVLSNHDVVRHVTRYGGGELGPAPGPRRALLMLALPGGAYVYQGEELGLPEILDLPDELRQDPTFLRTGGTQKGRDGCRVPLPWSGTEPPFGFGPGTTAVAAATGRAGPR